METLKGTDIQKAARLLKEGRLVGLPTETVYGLAANALDKGAVLSVFAAKKRPSFDPLIVHLPDISHVSRYAYADETSLRLIRGFSPGPVTFILPKKKEIPDVVTSGLPTVGIRIPGHPLALELLRAVDFPVAAPSANLFGTTSPGTADHVISSLGDAVSYVLDGGPCEVGVESTIIRCSEGDVEVLRLGGLTIEAIEEVLNKKVTRIKLSSSRPEAPGMLHKHYNPGLPVHIVDFDSLPEVPAEKRVAVISFAPREVEGNVVFNEALSKTGEVSEAAKNLFGALRRAKDSGADLIWTEWVPDEGLGRAVNDRLKRASTE